MFLCLALSQALPQRFGERDRQRQQQFPGGFNANNQNPFFPPNNQNNVNINSNINSNSNNNSNQQTIGSTTTAAPTTATTASPQYLNCLQNCPSTSEYNPICGSDSIDYHNSGRLSCAQRCGKSKS